MTGMEYDLWWEYLASDGNEEMHQVKVDNQARTYLDNILHAWDNQDDGRKRVKEKDWPKVLQSIQALAGIFSSQKPDIISKGVARTREYLGEDLLGSPVGSVLIENLSRLFVADEWRYDLDNPDKEAKKRG